MTPRRWFHVLLGAVLVPVVSLPVVWWVAVASWRRADDGEARRWARRMLGLAAVDTVVLAAIVALAASGAPTTDWRAVGGPVALRSKDPVLIGVLPDTSFRGRGARIAEVRPGSPADLAGVRAGDVVVALAGDEIADFTALRGAVSAREPGVAAPVVVVRGDATVSLTVTPRRMSDLEAERRSRLDAASRLEACAPRIAGADIGPLAAIVVALAVLAAVVRRRARDSGAARAIGWTGVALVASAAATQAIASGACVAAGGAPTITGIVLAIGASAVVLGGTAFAALRRAPREEGPPERSWRSATALGGWYLATGLPRVAVLAGAGTLLAAVGPAEGPIELFVRALVEERAWMPLLLLGASVVLLAPVAEELAFRGLLQPALGRGIGSAGAIAATSLLFAAAHWYYGPKLPLIALVGAVLGWARVASGGLRAPIALHALVNAVNLAAILLAT